VTQLKPNGFPSQILILSNNSNYSRGSRHKSLTRLSKLSPPLLTYFPPSPHFLLTTSSGWLTHCSVKSDICSGPKAEMENQHVDIPMWKALFYHGECSHFTTLCLTWVAPLLSVVRDHVFVCKQPTWNHVKTRSKLDKSSDRDCHFRTLRPFYPCQSHQARLRSAHPILRDGAYLR
jgi:hypothetical protein